MKYWAHDVPLSRVAKHSQQRKVTGGDMLCFVNGNEGREGGIKFPKDIHRLDPLRKANVYIKWFYRGCTSLKICILPVANSGITKVCITNSDIQTNNQVFDEPTVWEPVLYSRYHLCHMDSKCASCLSLCWMAPQYFQHGLTYCPAPTLLDRQPTPRFHLVAAVVNWRKLRQARWSFPR